MNKLNKKQMKELEELKNTAVEAIQLLNIFLDELQEETQECFENRSEVWQESEKAECYETWIQDIESKNDEICNIKDELSDIDFDDIQTPYL